MGIAAKLGALVDGLLRPHPRIDQPADRAAARLFAGFMLVHIAAVVAMLLVGNHFQLVHLHHSIWATLNARIIIGASLLRLGTYLLLRRGYFRPAVFAYIALSTITPLITAFTAQTTAEVAMLALAVVPLFLCAMVYPPRAVFWLLSGIAAATFVELALVPQPFPVKATAVILLGMVVITGVLIYYFRAYFAALEASRLTAVAVSEAKYRNLFELVADGIFIANAQGRFIEANEAACQQLGHTRAELLELSVTDITPRDPRQISEMMDSLSAGRIHSFETQHRRRDATLIDIELSITRISYDGQPAFLGVARDITEHKQAEHALRESEERYRLLAETAQELISVVDLSGRIIYANSAVLRLSGYSAAELAELPLDQLAAPDQLPLWEELLHGSQHGQLEAVAFSTDLLTKDGRRVPLDVNSVPILQGGEVTSLLSVARDATERVKAEKAEGQLRQMQKMEAIGTLAGGIAHDFNNILFAIQGNAEVAYAASDKASAVAEHLSQILQVTDRATALVKQILAFSRRGETMPVKLNPSLLVKEVYKLLRPALPSSIDLRMDTSASQARIRADAVELHQVLMNLCTNAAQALADERGRIEITLADVVLDAEFASTHPALHPGLYVRLSVSDDGCGMADAVKQRIFEPFFTTKAPGTGTGMGMAVVHGIVNKLHGAIDVYSQPGHGTTFSIHLPAVEQSAPGADTEPPLELPTGTGRLLVVDDEEAIVRLLKQMLDNLGYTVTVFTDSPAALEFFRADPQAVDLVLTDMTMPALNGAELAQAVLALRPGLPVLLCTGFSRVVSAEMAQELGLAGFLMKPVSRFDLAHAVANALSPVA